MDSSLLHHNSESSTTRTFKGDYSLLKKVFWFNMVAEIKRKQLERRVSVYLEEAGPVEFIPNAEKELLFYPLRATECPDTCGERSSADTAPG